LQLDILYPRSTMSFYFSLFDRDRRREFISRAT